MNVVHITAAPPSPAPHRTPKSRSLAPATQSIASTTGTNVVAVPRSGCTRINPTGNATRKSGGSREVKLLSTSRSVRYAVTTRTATIFMNSDGCKLTGEKKRLSVMKKEGLTEAEVVERYPELAGRRIRYSGTGDVPRLREWASKPFKGRRESETCKVCGSLKATKRTGCDYLCP